MPFPEPNQEILRPFFGQTHFDVVHNSQEDDTMRVTLWRPCPHGMSHTANIISHFLDEECCFRATLVLQFLCVFFVNVFQLISGTICAVYPAFVQCILTHRLLVLTHDKDGPAENASLHVVKCRQLQALHVCRVDGLWVEDVLIVEHVLKAGPVDRVYQRCLTGFVDVLNVL